MNAITSLSGLLDDRRRWPITRESLNPPLSLRRAQSTTLATATAADGMTLLGHGADQARFNGAARRLRIEGQRTNAVRNPRGQGAAAGTPGTLPTFWSVQNTPVGMTREVVDTGTENGMNYIELMLFGTPTANAEFYLIFDATTAIAAVMGQVWSASLSMRWVGTPTGVTTVTLGVEERSGAGGFLVADGTTVAVSGAFARFSATRAMGNAACAFANAYVAFLVQAGVPVSARVRLAWPQLEMGAFASSPILPPIGSPAASTRGADLVTATLTSQVVGANGACTVLGTFMLTQTVSLGLTQTLLAIDGGSANERWQVTNASGAAIGMQRVTGGASVSSGTAGSFAPGLPFRIGITCDGAGRLALCIEGGAVEVLTGAPTSGMTTLRVGSNVASANPMFGETAPLSVLPWALPDLALAMQVLALPL
ncbi:hypothetical protein ACLF3G_04490 [Falsiroseomonas sp. HC035]|uniref:hypothetical protein n=1 Tax=Falsiroseomonas sp. HC035 TaxID=3390999 RepID=UPI003D317BB8